MAQSEIERLVRQCVLNELGAMLLYTRLSERLQSPEAKRVVSMLAAAEEAHIGKITEIVGILGDEGTRALARVGFVKALREEANRRLEEQMADLGLTRDHDAASLLDFAISTEARAGNQYAKAAAEASDPRLRDFFATLVAEEESHGAQLEGVRRMLELSSQPR